MAGVYSSAVVVQAADAPLDGLAADDRPTVGHLIALLTGAARNKRALVPEDTPDTRAASGDEAIRYHVLSYPDATPAPYNEIVALFSLDVVFEDTLYAHMRAIDALYVDKISLGYDPMHGRQFVKARVRMRPHSLYTKSTILILENTPVHRVPAAAAATAPVLPPGGLGLKRKMDQSSGGHDAKRARTDTPNATV